MYFHFLIFLQEYSGIPNFFAVRPQKCLLSFFDFSAKIFWHASNFCHVFSNILLCFHSLISLPEYSGMLQFFPCQFSKFVAVCSHS